MSLDKETLASIGLVVTLVSMLPYCYSIFYRGIKPHAFSWIIWALLTGIGYAAMTTAGAGPGAWVTGLSSLLCLLIGVLAIYKGERNITKSDWMAFGAAILIMPCWYFARDPLVAILLVSLIDVIGYYPTFRKSYHKPHEELLFTHLIGSLKYIFALLALGSWSLTTWLYPVSIIAANMALVFMLMIRRKQLA
jgi:hypothetical protein